MNKNQQTEKRTRKTSKFLSYVLRHRPDEIGIELDEHGWVDVDVLLEAARRNGREISRELLETVIETNDKKRFALSDDGTRIRASQGHSVEVDLDLEPIEPPDVLYQGTVARFLDAIRAEGLKPMNRHHVHLSHETATAKNVGSRRGRPVILAVDAARMHSDGHKFYRSANGVWLTDKVPPEYIQFPEDQ